MMRLSLATWLLGTGLGAGLLLGCGDGGGSNDNITTQEVPTIEVRDRNISLGNGGTISVSAVSAEPGVEVQLTELRVPQQRRRGPRNPQRTSDVDP